MIYGQDHSLRFEFSDSFLKNVDDSSFFICPTTNKFLRYELIGNSKLQYKQIRCYDHIPLGISF